MSNRHRLDCLASQASLKSILDRGFDRLTRRIEQVVSDEIREMLFSLAMDRNVLRYDQAKAINALIHNLRNDRELCNRLAINQCRRHVDHVLQPVDLDDRRYRRWSKH